MKIVLQTKPCGKVRKQNLYRALYNKPVKHGINHKDISVNDYRTLAKYITWEISGTPSKVDITDCINDFIDFCNKPYFSRKFGLRLMNYQTHIYIGEWYSGRDGDVFHFQVGAIIHLADGSFKVHTKFSTGKRKGEFCDLQSGEPFDITPYVTRVEE